MLEVEELEERQDLDWARHLLNQAKLKAENPEAEELQDRIKPDSLDRSLVAMRH